MLYRLKIQVPHCVKTTMNLSFPSLSLTLSHSLSLFLLQPSFVCSHVSFFYKTISNISKISLYQLFLRLSPLKGRTKPGIQMADIRGYDPLNILNQPRLPPLNSPDPIFISGGYPQFGYWVLLSADKNRFFHQVSHKTNYCMSSSQRLEFIKVRF